VSGPFICDQCVDMVHKIVQEKRGNPDRETIRRREIKLEELMRLRADVTWLRERLARIDEAVHAPPFWMVEEKSSSSVLVQ
jgi:hypothetical protein